MRSVKFSSVHHCFILGHTWSWLCQVQNACVPLYPLTPQCFLFPTQVAMWATKWNRQQADSQIQTPSYCRLPDGSNHVFSFLGKESQFGFLKTVGHPWAKLIATIHMFLSGFPKRKLFDTGNVMQPNHTYGKSEVKRKGQETVISNCM